MADFQVFDWMFSSEMLDSTPSIKEGYSRDEEKQHRSKSVWFIKSLGKELRCEPLVLSTAYVLFHRFFVFQSFLKHDRFIISASCLFLAAKVEECYRTAKDVVSAYKAVRVRTHNFNVERESSGLLEKLLFAERIVLQTLCFDLQITHPYATCFQKSKALKAYVPQESRLDLYQVAVNFVNDSYRTSLCLQYRPNQIAIAAYFLATLHMSIKPIGTNVLSPTKSEVTWFDLLEPDVEETVLKDICNQILEVYTTDPSLSTLPTLPELLLKLNGSDTGKQSFESYVDRLEDTSSPSSENKSPDTIVDLYSQMKQVPPKIPAEAYKPFNPSGSQPLQPSPYHPLPAPPMASPQSSSHWSHSSPASDCPPPPESDSSPGYYIQPPSSRYSPEYKPPIDTPTSCSCPPSEEHLPPPADSPTRSESSQRSRVRSESNDWAMPEPKRSRVEAIT